MTSLKNKVEEAETARGLVPVTTAAPIRCGIDSWGEDGGARVEFVHRIHEGMFRVVAFWTGSQPLPDWSCSRPIAANERARVWESGYFRGTHEKRYLISALYLGLLRWPEALAAAGYVCPLTPAILEVRDEAILWHRDEQKFARDQAHENHFLRLTGAGFFDAGRI